MESVCQPYRFALLQRLHSYYDSLTAQQQTEVDDLLDRSGMTDVLTARLDRRLGWENNLDIWQ